LLTDIFVTRQVIKVLFNNYSVSSLVVFGSFDISLYRRYWHGRCIDTEWAIDGSLLQRAYNGVITDTNKHSMDCSNMSQSFKAHMIWMITASHAYSERVCYVPLVALYPNDVVQW